MAPLPRFPSWPISDEKRQGSRYARAWRACSSQSRWFLVGLRRGLGRPIMDHEQKHGRRLGIFDPASWAADDRAVLQGSFNLGRPDPACSRLWDRKTVWACLHLGHSPWNRTTPRTGTSPIAFTKVARDGGDLRRRSMRCNGHEEGGAPPGWEIRWRRHPRDIRYESRSHHRHGAPGRSRNTGGSVWLVVPETERKPKTSVSNGLRPRRRVDLRMRSRRRGTCSGGLPRHGDAFLRAPVNEFYEIVGARRSFSPARGTDPEHELKLPVCLSRELL